MVYVEDLLATPGVALGVVVFVLAFGLIVGSFLNVVIYRLPVSMLKSWKRECEEFLQANQDLDASDGQFNVAFPASHCPRCKASIKPWQNIPVISFLLLRGRCANCQCRIALRYPLVEITTGLLTLFCFYRFGISLEGMLVAVLTWCLIALTMIDIDHKLLPDNLTLPLMWLGLLANSQGVFTDLQSSVIGAAAGYLTLWTVFWLFKLVTGKEGMGFGDFKLLAALGAWMGWQMLPLVIILSSFVGALLGIGGILLQGRDKNVPIPFGPYLAIAGWIAFFWGETITQAYLQFAKVG